MRSAITSAFRTALATFALASPASAQEPTEPLGEPKQPDAQRDERGPALLADDPPPGWPSATSPKRRVPNYGQSEEAVTPGDVAIWAPRVAFLPAYLVSEFVLRRPLGVLITMAERERLISEISDFFTFGPNQSIGLVPTALVDFGFRSSLGVYGFWDDFLVKKNQLRMHAGFGGTDWLRFTFADSVLFSKKTEATARLELWRRPDGFFYGLGPRTRREHTSRFASDTIDLRLGVLTRPARSVTVTATAGFRKLRFADGTCCDDPGLLTRAGTGAFEVPRGFDTGFELAREVTSLAFDTRRDVRGGGSGVRVELADEIGLDLDNPFDAGSFSFVKARASIGVYRDVGYERVIGLIVQAEDTLIGEPPFTELVQTGGMATLRGFREGRLRGESGATAALEWRWPIWAFLDGSLQAGVGNAFSQHFEDFQLDLLRMAFAVGFRTSGARDHSFNVLFGTGTETIEQGAQFNEVRVLFGTTQGF